MGPFFLCVVELRLKKKHKPFYMVQQWDELCSKYTDAKAEDISNGELTSHSTWFSSGMNSAQNTQMPRLRTSLMVS